MGSLLRIMPNAGRASKQLRHPECACPHDETGRTGPARCRSPGANRAEFRDCHAVLVQTPILARIGHEPPIRRGLNGAISRTNPQKARIHMARRFGTISLWLLGCAIVFASFNIYDPYLIMMRGWGGIGLLVASLTVTGALLARRSWPARSIAARLLVVLWCLPLVGRLAAETTFQAHRQSVLHAEGAEVQQLGRHFIIGYTSAADVAPLAAKGLIGGIYVSHYNIKGRTAAALKSEITTLQDIRRSAGLPPLIVATDQEGGIVSHLSPQLTPLPALSTLAALPRDERAAAAETFGRIHGRELAGLGVTLNFAPVVDLLSPYQPNPFDFNSLISRRAISGDPAVVAEIATAYVRGLETSGVEATVKHFPGMGRVRADTHHFRADLDTPLGELEASDWIPFRQTLAQSNAWLMVGHVAVTAVDSTRAASHSRAVINDLIRGQWGFQGIIVTDDLVMGAIYQHGICSATVEALNAGADLLLVAYDGLQYYRVFDCALAASSRGELDRLSLQESDVRLLSRIQGHLANTQTGFQPVKINH
jgi:beta-N-acetylhexosaminidase